MKKILIILILFINFFPVKIEALTGNLTSSGENLTNSGKIVENHKNEKLDNDIKIIEKNIEEKIKEEQKKDLEDNIVSKAYKKRKEQIIDLVKKTPEEIALEKNQKIIESLKIENELNKELLEKLQNQINDLQKNLQEKENDIKQKEELIKQLSKNKKEKIDLIKKLQKQKKDLNDYKFRLLSKINAKKRLEEKIKNLEALEEQYNLEHKELIDAKEKLAKKNFEKFYSKLNILFIFFSIIFFLYLLRYLVLNHTNFKKKHTKLVTVGELSLGIVIVIFGIWYFFYLFPNLYILIIFLSGYLLLVNAHLIASFMGSLIVVNKYSVGEIVKTGNYLGKIVKIGTIYTVISEIDEKGFLHKNYKYIPNVIIVKEGLEKVEDYTLKQRTFTIRLKLNKNKTIFKIIDYIKINILQKYINFRPKHLDPENNDVFEIKYEQEKVGEVKITFFWFSSEEVSRKIKKRIIGYIEQETCLINDEENEEIKKEEKEEKKQDNDFNFVGV